MFKKSPKGYYYWDEFAVIGGVIHGFSTRKFGDMNWKKRDSAKNLEQFCRALNINQNKAVRMDQVHGNNVKVVGHRDSGQDGYQTVTRQARMTIVDSTDGLLSSRRGIFLLVTFADCVPVLFLDKNKKLFGIAHAGWKGVYSEIVKAMVDQMVNKGSKKSDIMAGLGPSIGACCYDVDKKRAELFKNKFPKLKGLLKIRDDKSFLDLAKIVKNQLKNSGILDRHIFDANFCTKDNHSEFYSFRKEGGTKSFGLSCGVLGYEKS